MKKLFKLVNKKISVGDHQLSLPDNSTVSLSGTLTNKTQCTSIRSPSAWIPYHQLPDEQIQLLDEGVCYSKLRIDLGLREGPRGSIMYWLRFYWLIGGVVTAGRWYTKLRVLFETFSEMSVALHLLGKLDYETTDPRWIYVPPVVGLTCTLVIIHVHVHTLYISVVVETVYETSHLCWNNETIRFKSSLTSIIIESTDLTLNMNKIWGCFKVQVGWKNAFYGETGSRKGLEKVSARPWPLKTHFLTFTLSVKQNNNLSVFNVQIIILCSLGSWNYYVPDNFKI